MLEARVGGLLLDSFEFSFNGGQLDGCLVFFFLFHLFHLRGFGGFRVDG